MQVKKILTYDYNNKTIIIIIEHPNRYNKGVVLKFEDENQNDL